MTIGRCSSQYDFISYSVDCELQTTIEWNKNMSEWGTEIKNLLQKTRKNLINAP